MMERRAQRRNRSPRGLDGLRALLVATCLGAPLALAAEDAPVKAPAVKVAAPVLEAVKIGLAHCRARFRLPVERGHPGLDVFQSDDIDAGCGDVPLLDEREQLFVVAFRLLKIGPADDQAYGRHRHRFAGAITGLPEGLSRSRGRQQQQCRADPQLHRA